MASSARIDEIKKKFDENPRRYFAPLANEFRKAGDLEQAIIICEEFLPQQAGHMSGHIVYGQALFESGRLPESRTVFETALGLDPENLIALRHLGDIARSQGEMAAARQWYDRVLEADPRNEEIQGIIGALAGGDAAAGTGGRDDDANLMTDAMPAPSAPSGAPPALAAIDLDMDADFGVPSAPPPPAAAAPPAPVLLDAPFGAVTLDGLQPTSAESATAAGLPDAREARAEGLEPAEFEAPTDPQARAPGLEPAEFEAPAAAPPRAEGLETSEFAGAGSRSSVDDSLMDLETSFSPGRSPGAASNVPPFPLDGLEPTGATQPPAREPSASPSIGALPDFDGEPAEEAPSAGSQAERSLDGLPMMELTPAVIDAESKLMDAGESYDSATADGREDVVSGNQPPFVTETMAELYLKQGFREQALDVYRQLASASPADARLAARVQELERGGAEAHSAVATGATVRDFFHRLAMRRPGERGIETAPPAGDDFASPASAAPPRSESSSSGFTASSDALDTMAPEAPASTRESAVAGLPMYDDAPAAAAPEYAAPVAVAPSSWEFVPTPEPARRDDSAAASGAVATPSLDTAAEPLPDWEPTPAPAAVAAEPAAPRDPGPTPSPMPSAAERGAAARGGAASGGTIDALFGTRTAGRSEDSAASALAQAFGGSLDAPAITGRPARAAAQELSLDSVFRDGPARATRASQSFSFDQFFSESAAPSEVPAGRPPDVAPAGEPAERSADDIQQFNSWLQGLKQR